VPRASNAGAAGRHDGIPRLRVKSPPADGRANAEAEKLLSKILGVRVALVGGASSRRKTFEVNLSPAALRARLDEAF
jgi:uncharacterized protein YggU (UPF0235/DUF167 family)